MSTESFPELSPADQRLLDALVECGFDPAAVPVGTDAERLRLSRLVSLLALLQDYPVEDADDTLIHATLARIDRAEHEATSRRRFGAAIEDSEADAAPRLRIRLPDFITIAAVLLIATSIVVPVTGHLKRKSIDGRCADNLRTIGMAFGRYAGDHAGAMPTAMANIGPDMISWDQVRNVINLHPLVKDGYCEFGHLSCPGRHEEGPGYSYQWQVPGRRAVWGQGPSTILGDRNPLIDAALQGVEMPALSMSLNHGGRGQNVLANDGSQAWLEEPVVGADNIWLPQGHSVLRLGDRPAAGDAFLAH